MDQLGLVNCHQETDRCPVRPAHQGDRFESEFPDELGQIVGVGVHRELSLVVGPRGRAEVALRGCDHAIAVSQALGVGSPDPMVRVRWVYEHDRGTVALIGIGTLNV